MEPVEPPPTPSAAPVPPVPPVPSVPEPARDPREPMPRWVWKAIVAFWAGLVVLWLLKGFVHSLRDLFITLLLSAFLSFAIEPAVNRLARRGWRRGTATWLVFLLIFASGALFTGVMGSLVVTQVQKFVDKAPDYLDNLERWINDHAPGDAKVDFSEVQKDLQDPSKGLQRFSDDLASMALDFSSRALGLVFQGFTILLFTFYLVADGPRFRRTICSRLRPEQQRRVISTWELAIEKTGGYLYSRALLAVLSAAYHWVALQILGVPYALALALWVGVVSQFIPVVGTYLAGAFPVAIALFNSPLDGLWVLALVVVYQQIENYLFAPRVTAHTLSLHPAVAFGTVIAGAALIGPVGALLALPFGAVVQALISTMGEQYDVVETPLTREHQPRSLRRILARRQTPSALPGPTRPGSEQP